MVKQRTNEDYLKALLKNITTIEAALLRERIQKIADMTRDSIAKDSKPFNNILVGPTDWLRLCDKIDLYLANPDTKWSSMPISC